MPTTSSESVKGVSETDTEGKTLRVEEVVVTAVSRGEAVAARRQRGGGGEAAAARGGGEAVATAKRRRRESTVVCALTS